MAMPRATLELQLPKGREHLLEGETLTLLVACAEAARGTQPPDGEYHAREIAGAGEQPDPFVAVPGDPTTLAPIGLSCTSPTAASRIGSK